jgi:hypothetical protein
MLFVAEDNGYAESTASSWSVGGSQVGRGTGFGIPSREVSGSEGAQARTIGSSLVVDVIVISSGFSVCWGKTAGGR